MNVFLQKVLDVVMLYLDSGLPIEEMYGMFTTIIDPQAEFFSDPIEVGFKPCRPPLQGRAGCRRRGHMLCE